MFIIKINKKCEFDYFVVVNNKQLIIIGVFFT